MPLATRGRRLAATLGFGVNVAERHGSRQFYLCHFEGSAAPRSTTLIGRDGPLHATAVGKALVSELSRSELHDLLGASYARYTPHTITSLDELLAALDNVRQCGYSTEIEELAFGRACLAAPIRDRSGRTVGALSVSGPLSAMNLTQRQDDLAMTVIEHADKISADLGYHATVTVVP